MRQLITVMLMLAMLPASAQRIQTVDEKGEPVPYVSVLTTDAQLIGITDFNGVIDDVKGADIIRLKTIRKVLQEQMTMMRWFGDYDPTKETAVFTHGISITDYIN